MGNGKSRRHNQGRSRGNIGKPGGRNGKAGPVNRKELEKALPAAKEEAAEAVGGDENLPDPGEAPANVGYLTIDRLWREVATVKEAYETARKQHDEAREQVETVMDELEKDLQAEKEAWTAEQEKAAQAAAVRDQDLRDRQAVCEEREERLTSRELELARQEETAKSKAGEAVREALASARQELVSERDRLAAERKDYRAELKKIRIQQEDLEDERELFKQRVQREVVRQAEQWQLNLQALEKRHATLLEDHERLEGELAGYERVKRDFPDFAPGRVLAELRDLEAENARLKADRPGGETVAELERLRKAEQRWAEDLAVLQAENARLQQKLGTYTINAFELQRMEVVNRALEADKEAYREAVQQLRDDFDGLKRRKEGISPFPECFRMDTEHRHTPDDLVDDMPPLSAFIEQLRHFIARQDGLFYSAADLRLFLAGLAATRLHLLQGPSGTGKTQLPLVFAKAINAFAAVVPVGADWRTPQDLAGYYNTFERRFYESKFTQAVYRAGRPEFAAQPFFVVLDEMNLSHPEQYFSAVLSALEVKEKNNDAAMQIELMTTREEPAPEGLLNGRMLPLPDNIFFVGTANQDETTVGFAEKTFDRSNVLELPIRPTRFEPEPVDALPPFSLKALRRKFKEAKRNPENRRAARTVKEFVSGELRDRIWRDFRIDVGPRALTHLDSFVPVVHAAGGSVREAADHVVATRVLRKIRGHYEFRSGTIQSFRDDLPNLWASLPGGPDGPSGPGGPVRSIELLNEELHRRGGV